MGTLYNHYSSDFGLDVLTVTANKPTAIESLSFTATPLDGAVLLEWEIGSEIDNPGFNLYRAESLDGPIVRLNAALIPSRSPGSAVGAVYQWEDKEVRAGATYSYWLEDVDYHGRSTQHGPVYVTLTEGLSSGYRAYLPSVGKSSCSREQVDLD